MDLTLYMFRHRLQRGITTNYITISSEEGNKTLKKSTNEDQEMLDFMDIQQNQASFVEMHTLS